MLHSYLNNQSQLHFKIYDSIRHFSNRQLTNSILQKVKDFSFGEMSLLLFNFYEK
jgi:hypothetical protein